MARAKRPPILALRSAKTGIALSAKQNAPDNAKSDYAPRSYGQNKRTKTLRFTPETFRMLREDSLKQGVSETVYVEMALKVQFKKDGIK
jgi:hypothetical protein